MLTYHLILECSFRAPAGRAALRYTLQKSIDFAAGRANRGPSKVLAKRVRERRRLIERYDGQLDRSFKRRHPSVLNCAATGERRPVSFTERGRSIEDLMKEPLYAVVSRTGKKVALNARRR